MGLAARTRAMAATSAGRRQILLDFAGHMTKVFVMALGLARSCLCAVIAPALAVAQVTPAIPKTPPSGTPPLPERPRLPPRQRPLPPLPSAPQIPVVVGYPSAQPAPLPFEVGLAYSYNAFDAGGSAVAYQSGASLYGEYFLKQTAELRAGRAVFGVRADFTGSGSNTANLYSYMFGPRINYEFRGSRLFSTAEFEIGGAHARVYGGTLNAPFPSLAGNSFAFGTKEAIGLVFGQRYVVNLLETEFLNFEVPQATPPGKPWRTDIRASAGMGFRLGRR